MGYNSFVRLFRGLSRSFSRSRTLHPNRIDYLLQPASIYEFKEANLGLGFRSLHLNSLNEVIAYGNPMRATVGTEQRAVITRMLSRGVGSRQDVDMASRGDELEAKVRQYSGHKSQSTLLYLVAMVVGMVGITYASVPLYRKFCQATGYGGTVQRRETVEEKIARHSQEDPSLTRELVVQFNADVADGMPWRFTPCQREVRVRPGQSTLAFYTAENRSLEPITGVSTYNVTPMKAGVYFNKIQCFCFEEQRLLPGEKIDMPVFFYIDPEFATDPKMNGINNLILSYTFFKVEDAKD